MLRISGDRYPTIRRDGDWHDVLLAKSGFRTHWKGVADASNPPGSSSWLFSAFSHDVLYILLVYNVFRRPVPMFNWIYLRQRFAILQMWYILYLFEYRLRYRRN